jgi:hypothetical protein
MPSFEDVLLVLTATGASGPTSLPLIAKGCVSQALRLWARKLSPFLANLETCTKSSTAACLRGTSAGPSTKSQLGAQGIFMDTLQGVDFGARSV